MNAFKYFSLALRSLFSPNTPMLKESEQAIIDFGKNLSRQASADFERLREEQEKSDRQRLLGDWHHVAQDLGRAWAKSKSEILLKP